MKKKIFYFLILQSFSVYSALTSKPIAITQKEAEQIGKKIWYNECKGTIEGLTSWNQGEIDFASLGIGHFIWYTKNPSTTFKESFPSLLIYLKNHNVKLPGWLEKSSHCPWHNRQEFLAAKQSKRMQELRSLLTETIDLQTQFIIENLADAVSKFQKKLPPKKYLHIKNQFYRIAKSPNGLYTLIDYANFKGVGFNPKEAYNNQGWGLIQVLERLKGTNIGKPALEEFAQSAKHILTARVKNAPSERNESRWLKGWFNRIDTYIQ